MTVERAAGEEDLAAYAALVTHVYTTDGLEGTQRWVQRSGPENVRVLRSGGKVAGGLLLAPMGQWFGGRSVPMNGIVAVAIPPEHRGGGAATTLMRETVRQLRDEGFPLSALYPSTQTLYRRAGWERAGVKLRITVPMGTIGLAERDLTVRPATEADHPAMEACYAARAKASQGLLDRGPYVWGRVRASEDDVIHGYVVEESGRVTGYTHFCHERPAEGMQRIWCTDLVATTPAAGRRLLSFLGDHRTLAGEVGWHAAPSDPFLGLLPENRGVTVKARTVWMLRLCDVERALAERGWPVGVDAELHLDVADDLIPENAGRWTVRVAGGRAEVARGGRGTLRCDVRGLASLYTGFLSPHDAVVSGALEGPADAGAAATAAFAGPFPWMADGF